MSAGGDLNGNGVRDLLGGLLSNGNYDEGGEVAIFYGAHRGGDRRRRRRDPVRGRPVFLLRDVRWRSWATPMRDGRTTWRSAPRASALHIVPGPRDLDCPPPSGTVRGITASAAGGTETAYAMHRRRTPRATTRGPAWLFTGRWLRERARRRGGGAEAPPRPVRRRCGRWQARRAQRCPACVRRHERRQHRRHRHRRAGGVTLSTCSTALTGTYDTTRRRRPDRKWGRIGPEPRRQRRPQRRWLRRA